MNLLMPSTGRRVSLIRLFRAAASQRRIPLRIIGTEVNPLTASLIECDRYALLPRTGTQEHWKAFTELLKSEGIDFLLPGNDVDLHWLVQNEQEFSCPVLYAGASRVAPFLSKAQTARVFEQAGLQIPEVCDPNSVNLPFPLIVKEDAGYGSLNQYRVESSAELSQVFNRLKKPFLQKWIEGVEYTVDVFSGSCGEPYSIVPRIRTSVRAGVSDTGRIDLREDLIHLIDRLSRHVKLAGPWNVQCFATQEGFQFIEINPRFSGGIPLTEAAGADFCGMTLDWAMGRQIQRPGVLRDQLVMLKYESEMFCTWNSREGRCIEDM